MKYDGKLQNNSNVYLDKMMIERLVSFLAKFVPSFRVGNNFNNP